MNETPNQNLNDEAAELPDWEEKINALLEGELDADQTQQLKAAASADPALSQALIEAYELQRALESIPLQPAPASLRRKLARIPVDQRREAGVIRLRTGLFGTGWLRAGWVTGLAAIPVLIIALGLRGPTEPAVTEPTAAQIIQAQHELAIAFSYLEKVSLKTGREIGTTVNHEIEQSINQNMIRTIQDQMEFNKERNA